MVERGGGGEQCRTDRGQPFGTALHRTDGSGKRGGVISVAEPCPPDRDRDAVGIRPFENQGFDPPLNSRNRADEPGVLERTRNAVALQQIGIGRHTGRHVDREHQRKTGAGRRRRFGQHGQQRQYRKKNGH
jgi:hypothetical protein